MRREILGGVALPNIAIPFGRRDLTLARRLGIHGSVLRRECANLSVSLTNQAPSRDRLRSTNPAGDAPSFQGNPAQEALRVLEEAERRGVALKLLGGLAFCLRCPSARTPALSRNYGDMDVVGHEKESKGIRSLFLSLGYTGRERFNALQGQRRLIFEDLEKGIRADIFLDVFEMCHRFDFSKRLGLDRYTLSVADLLVTKLQIVEINDKDVKDILALLLDYDVGDADGPLINGGYIANLCGSDWGIYKTFTMNLEKLSILVKESGLLQPEQSLVRDRIGRLLVKIMDEPKTMGWKMRARVGERVRWYQLPEET